MLVAIKYIPTRDFHKTIIYDGINIMPTYNKTYNANNFALWHTYNLKYKSRNQLRSS